MVGQPRYRAPGSTDRRITGSRTPSTSDRKLRDLYDRAPRRTGADLNDRTARRVGDHLSDRYRQRKRADLDRLGDGIGRTAPRPGDSSKTPRRVNPRRVDDRYRVPGPTLRRGSPLAPVGPTKSAPRPSSGSPTLRDTTARRVLSGGRLDVEPVARPRTPTLGAPRRSTPVLRDTRYSYARSTRYSYGAFQWSGHSAALSLSFGWSRWSRWGYYAFPFWLGCSWPSSYYYTCHDRYAGYWNSCYPLRSSYCWWLPRRCYLPGSWIGFSYWGSYCNDYDYYYYAPATPIAIYTTVTGSRASGDTVTVGHTVGGDDGKTNLERLAEKHISLGDFYFKEGRFDEAAESYLRALAYVPDDASLHFVIADALFAQGDYHYAAFMITSGLKLDPELAHARADKREFYGDASLFDAQMETLRRYVADKPYDAAAQVVLGYNLLFSEALAAAEAVFAKVLEIEPANLAAKAFHDSLTGKTSPAAAEPERAAGAPKGKIVEAPPAEAAPGATGK